MSPKNTSNHTLHSTASNFEYEYPVQVYYFDLSKLYMHRIRWHWHDEIEIMIVNHGEAEFLAEDQVIHLTPGQGIFINENILHSLHPTDMESYTCSIYSVKFHPAYLFGTDCNPFQDAFLTPVQNAPEFRIFRLDEDDPWQSRILDSINDIIAANLAKKFGYQLLTKSCLLRTWSTLLEKINPQNPVERKQVILSLDESRVKDAITYIENHYADAMTLQELSDSLHISKSECCRCFKRTLQLTPIEYLMKFRIMKATEKLQAWQGKSLPISDLAYSVGFNNASYFNKVFREYLECTPSEYRRKVKEDPALTAESLNAIRF